MQITQNILTESETLKYTNEREKKGGEGQMDFDVFPPEVRKEAERRARRGMLKTIDAVLKSSCISENYRKNLEYMKRMLLLEEAEEEN